MATVFRIPVAQNRANQTIFTTLDGRRYQLDLRWNGRLERWFISITTGTGTALLKSKGLLVSADVLRVSRHNTDLPSGALLLEDTQNLGGEATLSSIGVRHLLTFIPRASFPSA